MNHLHRNTLIVTSLATLATFSPAHAAKPPEAEIQRVISRWATDIQGEDFGYLSEQLQNWTTRDFSFNSQSGKRAVERLIQAERDEVAGVRKSREFFEKTYSVKLQSSVQFEPGTIRINGETAVEEARLAYRLPATGKKKMPDGSVQGESGDLGHSETYRLTWTRTPLGWKIRSLKIRFNPMIGTALFLERPKGPRGGSK